MMKSQRTKAVGRTLICNMILYGLTALILVSCQSQPDSMDIINTPLLDPSETIATTSSAPLVTATPEQQVVPVQTSVVLYQAVQDGDSERVEPTPWFPITMYVQEFVLPYDADAVIKTIPVYTCYGNGPGCTWVGDLEAGTQVEVTSFENGYCFISGIAMQGWNVDGWVSCTSLREK